MSDLSKTKQSVQDYYGKTLQSSDDLKTDACCTAEALPAFVKPILSQVHDEVLMKYYGCGVVIPEKLKNAKIIDLGSGSGRDSYVLSKLVGPEGQVVGVDMTDEQLVVANKHIDYMTEKFGYSKANIQFLKGDIEKISDLGLPKNSFDIVTSNCVVNLAEDKLAVLKGAFELLKQGGEFYFSDVYSDRRVPKELVKDPVLYGECLSGALYWNDFIKMARQAGFTDPRLVHSRPLEIKDPQCLGKIGNIKFESKTYRLFKLDELEPDREDYAQAVRYNGGVPYHSNAFALDVNQVFEKGRIYNVCGNTFSMLKQTRFKENFDFWGDFSVHFGLYENSGSPMVASSPISVDSVDVEESVSTGGRCC